MAPTMPATAYRKRTTATFGATTAAAAATATAAASLAAAAVVPLLLLPMRRPRWGAPMVKPRTPIPLPVRRPRWGARAPMVGPRTTRKPPSKRGRRAPAPAPRPPPPPRIARRFAPTAIAIATATTPATIPEWRASTSWRREAAVPVRARRWWRTASARTFKTRPGRGFIRGSVTTSERRPPMLLPMLLPMQRPRTMSRYNTKNSHFVG
mmetsp:Transcript_21028/g.45872  ORF Transcript_21028/g.45872 Transcript_21028/m.45872 type:complete len:209 (+) Transcript_21028:617-1243(+)